MMMNRVILFWLVFLLSCSPQENCDADIVKIIEVVINDITQHHPAGFFITPPSLDQSTEPAAIDRSKLLFGISDKVDDRFLRETMKSKINVLIKDQYEIIEKCSFSLDKRQLKNISSDLDMPLVFTEHDPLESDFRYHKDGPEALFYFSSLRVLSHDVNPVYAISLMFYCGKLCGAEHLYFITRTKDGYSLMNSQKINPYEVK